MDNQQNRQGTRLPFAAAVVALSAACWLLCPHSHWTSTTPDALLVWLATWAAWLLGLYVVLAAAVFGLVRLCGRNGPLVNGLEAATPAVIRRTVDVLLGVTVSTSIVVATPVVAAAAPGSSRPAPAPSAIPSSLAWPVEQHTAHPQHPARASAPSPASTARRPVRTRATVDVVVVRRGDTLWDIAARHLPHPTTARVARAWPAWWTANRAAIGPDPDVIHPGDRLRSPATTSRRVP